MGVFDKVREFAEHLSESDEGPAKGSPAAASGGGSASARAARARTARCRRPGRASTTRRPRSAGPTPCPRTPDATPSTRLDTGGEDKPKHEDQRSENIASVAPSENVPASERDDV